MSGDNRSGLGAPRSTGGAVRGGILAVAFELNALLPQTAEKASASNRTAQPRSSAG
jgi:hypothetical protein